MLYVPAPCAVAHRDTATVEFGYAPRKLKQAILVLAFHNIAGAAGLLHIVTGLQ